MGTKLENLEKDLHNLSALKSTLESKAGTWDGKADSQELQKLNKFINEEVDKLTKNINSIQENHDELNNKIAIIEKSRQDLVNKVSELVKKNEKIDIDLA